MQREKYSCFVIIPFTERHAPLWEALQSLQEQGLVTNNPRRGMFVVELGEIDKQKINSVRIVLEAEALRLCRQRQSEAAENKLKKIIEDMSRPEHHWRLELEFHRTLWNLCGNEVLEKTLTNLTAPLFTHASTAALNEPQRNAAIASHTELLEYVQGKSDRKAEDLLLAHYRLGWSNPERYSSYYPGKS